jgi:hypothetical protein
MTRFVLISAFALTAHVVSAVRLEAQGAPEGQHRDVRVLDDLKTGARLRVSLLGDPPETLKGRLQGFGATTLILEVDGSRREMPMSSIVIVEEAYRDRKRSAIAGIAIGAIGVYAWDFFGPHPRYADQGKRFKENALALAATTVVGGLAGYAVGWPRWRSVSTVGR